MAYYYRCYQTTGIVLTDANEVLSFEAMLRAYNEKTKRFQANNHPAGGGHFKDLFKAFSTDAREPCQWCLKHLNKCFFTRSKIPATRTEHLWPIMAMETREPGGHPRASSAKSKVTGLLNALRRPIFKQWFNNSKGGPTLLHTRPRTTLSLTAS